MSKVWTICFSLYCQPPKCDQIQKLIHAFSVFLDSAKKKKRAHSESSCIHPDSTGHFGLNSLAGVDCSMCRLGLHSAPTFMAQETACQGPVSSWWCIFFLLGHSFQGSNTVLLHSNCSLWRIKTCSEGVCVPQLQNLSWIYCGDGFLIKHYTTTSCTVAHKDCARGNIHRSPICPNKETYFFA